MREHFFQVIPFKEKDADQWDAFIEGCPMKTILHSRRYLNYHGSRFEDRSLVLVDEQGRWQACIPAAKDAFRQDVVVSHPGVTYGGWLHYGALHGENAILAFEEALAFWRKEGFRKLLYKAVPWIYHAQPVQDDIYALFRLGAIKYRCDLSCALSLRQPLFLHDNRRRSLKRAEKNGLCVYSIPEDVQGYWSLLTKTLASRYGVEPTHSLSEIEGLMLQFPDEIKLITVKNADKISAGILLYLSPEVFHAQYIASSEEGNQQGALDLAFNHAIALGKEAERSWFSFGISNENEGKNLNQGLYHFKTGFGGHGVVHDFFSLNI